MTMSRIMAKLQHYGRKNALLLALCLVLSTLLVTSYALIYLSPTVQTILPEGGDSRKQGIMIFAVAILGCAIFTTYAASLFLRGKGRESGIFLALGADRGILERSLFREIALLCVGSGAAGVVLSVPGSYGVWKLFQLFIVDTREMQYRFGSKGLLLGLAFCVFVIACIYFLAVRFIRRTNLVEIMNEGRISEPVKDVKGWYGIAGCGFIAGGLLLGYAAPVIVMQRFQFVLPPVWNLVYLLSAVGVYMLMVYVVVHARRGRHPERYYKHIVSISMMRFMGRQTVRNMCVIALLIFGALFAVFYIPMIFSSIQVSVESNPWDYSFYHNKADSQMSREEIEALAQDYHETITGYEEAVGLWLTVDGSESEWLPSGKIIYHYYEQCGQEIFLSVSDYNRLADTAAEVTEGCYKKAVTSERLQSAYGDTTKITDPQTGEVRSYTYGGNLLFDDNITNSYGDIFYVLNDKDYGNYQAKLPQNSKVRMALFNVENWEGSYAFANALKAEIINRTPKESGLPKGYDLVVKQRYERQGEEYYFMDREYTVGEGILTLTPDNNQLATWWAYYPNFKVLMQQDSLKNMAVFLMLFAYIALICFAAVGIIAYTRGVTIAINNRQVFMDLHRLGADRKYLRFSIKNQLRKLFFYPFFVGSVIIFAFYSLIMWQNDGHFSQAEIGTIGVNIGLVLLIGGYLYLVYRITCSKFERVVFKENEALK